MILNTFKWLVLSDQIIRLLVKLYDYPAQYHGGLGEHRAGIHTDSNTSSITWHHAQAHLHLGAYNCGQSSWIVLGM